MHRSRETTGIDRPVEIRTLISDGIYHPGADDGDSGIRMGGNQQGQCEAYSESDAEQERYRPDHRFQNLCLTTRVFHCVSPMVFWPVDLRVSISGIFGLFGGTRIQNDKEYYSNIG